MRFPVAFRALTGMLALTGILAFSSVSALAADKVVSADQRLPPGVLLYVTSPNVVTTYNQFMKTSAGDLLRDPGLQKFFDQVKALVKEGQEKAEEELKLPLKDLVDLFSGEVAVAVVRPVGQPLGWVSLIQIGDRQSTLDTLLTRARESVDEDKKVTIETEDLDGTKVSVITITDSEEEEDAVPVSFSYCVKDGVFVAGSDVGVLETVLERWDGSSDEVFANNQIYQTILKKCTSDAAVKPNAIWFVDPVGLLASGLSMTPQTQNFAGMIYMPTLGLTGLKAIGGTYELDTKDFDQVSRSMVYLEGAPTGIVKIFQLRSSPVSIPAWVPADAGQYLSFDWDIKGAYEAIESIYDSFLGPGRFAMATANVLEQAGVNLKLKPDVIDVLSGKIEGYYNPGATSPEDFKGVFSIGVTDSAKGQKLVEGLWTLAGGSTSSSFEGATLFQGAGDDAPLVAAVKGNAIFLSTNQDNLKTALVSRTGPSLVDSENFKAVKKFLPANVSMLSYNDVRQQIGEVYEKARNGEFDGLAEGKLDFALLPPFESISKYFSPSAAYYTPDENGTLGVQFSLKRSK